MAIPTPNAAVAQGTLTTWFNPGDKPAVLDLFGHDGQFHRYVIPAGEEGVIPTEFDRGVQVRRGGFVVQGLGPHLIKRGAAPAEIHPSLDVAAQERKEADEKALAAKGLEDRAAIAAAAAEVKANNAALREQKAKAKREKAPKGKPAQKGSDD
jgi:hypothetical protein